MSDRLNVFLNGKKVNGYKGETILELAERHNINIPTLCHDPRIKPYSSCFLCVVDVKGRNGHQPSCSTEVQEGMDIETENAGVRKSRRAALELMLSNHYADCLGPCIQTCPAGVDVQAYISLIDKGQYHEAVKIIKDTNPLPAICGRVCVRPCEDACRRNLLEEGAAVGIDYLKRFASDYDLMSPNKYVPEVKPSTGKKIAVIGGGPGGLSAAHFLQIEGHQADIFETAPKAGGWLRYGIPEYRLPNDILDKEIKNITDLGVNLYTGKKLGDNLSFADLKKDYDATILTIGSQKGTLIGCEGDDAHNVVSGIDFLRNMEMTGQKHDFSGKTVAVVGGGNTAMDCCRTAKRCNAEKVYVVYRRAEEQMPANPIEIHESKLEGVEYLLLTNPKKVNKNENGYAKSVTLLKMELGEPDKSGRRRPIPIEGSEFDLPVDFIMAAIGQKTQVDFIEDINENADAGALELNRWGDIDANPDTLQTGIPDVFAAGDGVTGPATIIEAIAQAKLASHSANQFVNGIKDIQPPKKEFFSKKENFREQKPEDYKGHFAEQKREEMPTLPPGSRVNFKEVELGYNDENVARHEAQRCLECGCDALYECDLKKYSTEYEAEQTSYAGDYNEFKVDFRHPFIEIDSNKCILCSRCIRMCKEVVGANALGLINRGFNTYVAPTLGDALQDTSCESCGMCIEACPTGAITENVAFKPGPVKTEVIKTPDYFGSEGFFFGLKERNKFWYGAQAIDDDANVQKLISPQAKFGYTLLNNAKRITKPMKKTDKGWETISFEDAYELIHQKIKEVKPDENAFFAGARLTNEELYLVQKLARGAAKTNNINSFHYLNRGDGYFNISHMNVPFEELKKAQKIVVMGTDLAEDHPVTGYLINQARNNGTEVVYVTNREKGNVYKKADKVIPVNSIHSYVRAVNHYLVSNHMENGLFIKDHIKHFGEFRQQLLSLDFDELYAHAKPCCMDHFVEFAKSINETEKTVFVFSEKQLSSNAAIEIRNMTIITGKLGKTASGMLALKEKNNAQGLADMGINSDYGVGGLPLKEALINKMKKVWNISDIPDNHTDINTLLQKQTLKNLFIFGEDPVGCAKDKTAIEKLIPKNAFMVIQDYFMTETAEKADLILPAAWPVESSGSFTNTQKHIQMFEKQTESPLTHDNAEQLIHLLKKFGMNGISNSEEALNEAFSLIAGYENEPLKTILTDQDNSTNLFNYGCDTVNKRVEEAFIQKGVK